MDHDASKLQMQRVGGGTCEDDNLAACKHAALSASQRGYAAAAIPAEPTTQSQPLNACYELEWTCLHAAHDVAQCVCGLCLSTVLWCPGSYVILRQPVLMHAAPGMEGAQHHPADDLMLTSHFPIDRKCTDNSACKPAPGQESYTQNNLDPLLRCKISTPTIVMHPRPTHTWEHKGIRDLVIHHCDGPAWHQRPVSDSIGCRAMNWLPAQQSMHRLHTQSLQTQKQRRQAPGSWESVRAQRGCSQSHIVAIVSTC